MKRLLTALAIVLTIAATTKAMTVDDIIELCRAGFEPDRIASIVEATGLDEPLGAQDWVTLKEQGCDEELVDALLAVLVPVDESEEYVGDDTETYQGSTNADVNIYLGGGYGYGWNDWWYSGFSFGWYDPYWSIGWTYWDPYWYSTWWGYRPYAYHYAWWGHPWYNYCQPSYCCYTWYDNHWNGSHDTYARYKSSRRGSIKSDSYSYAGAKTRTTVETGVMSKVKAKKSFASSTDVVNGGVKTRSTSSGVYKSKTATGGTSTTYTTRKTTSGSSTGTIKSGSSVKTGTRTTTTTPSTKGTYNPPASGAKTKTSGGTTKTPATKPDDSNTTTKSAPKTSEPAGTPTKSGSPKARSKGGSQSSLSRGLNSIEYTTARQARSYRSHVPSGHGLVQSNRGYSSQRTAYRHSAPGATNATRAPYASSYSSAPAPKVSAPRPSAPSSSHMSSTPSFSGGKSASHAGGSRAVARPK